MNTWNYLYPFSTENLTGFFTENLLRNKKVLLTGSSADQILVAQLYCAEKISHFDLNPFVEYFYELKKAAIKVLDYEEYLPYFYYNYKNESVFSKEKYQIIRKYLQGNTLDFWDTLYDKFEPLTIRKNLFFLDDEEFDMDIYYSFLPYMKKGDYYKLKKLSNYTPVEFIQTDILELSDCLTDKYDLVYFSNIFSRLEMVISGFYSGNVYLRNLIKFVEPILEHTEDNGIILLDYLYNHKKADIFDSSKKYTYHIRFPVKVFKCYDNILLYEVSNSNTKYNSNTDTIVGYQKRKISL